MLGRLVKPPAAQRRSGQKNSSDDGVSGNAQHRRPSRSENGRRQNNRPSGRRENDSDSACQSEGCSQIKYRASHAVCKNRSC